MERRLTRSLSLFDDASLEEARPWSSREFSQGLCSHSPAGSSSTDACQSPQRTYSAPTWVHSPRSFSATLPRSAVERLISTSRRKLRPWSSHIAAAFAVGLLFVYFYVHHSQTGALHLADPSFQAQTLMQPGSAAQQQRLAAELRRVTTSVSDLRSDPLSAVSGVEEPLEKELLSQAANDGLEAATRRVRLHGDDDEWVASAANAEQRGWPLKRRLGEGEADASLEAAAKPGSAAPGSQGDYSASEAAQPEQPAAIATTVSAAAPAQPAAAAAEAVVAADGSAAAPAEPAARPLLPRKLQPPEKLWELRERPAVPTPVVEAGKEAAAPEQPAEDQQPAEPEAASRAADGQPAEPEAAQADSQAAQEQQLAGPEAAKSNSQPAEEQQLARREAAEQQPDGPEAVKTESQPAEQPAEPEAVQTVSQPAHEQQPAEPEPAKEQSPAEPEAASQAAADQPVEPQAASQQAASGATGEALPEPHQLVAIEDEEDEEEDAREAQTVSEREADDPQTDANAGGAEVGKAEAFDSADLLLQSVFHGADFEEFVDVHIDEGSADQMPHEAFLPQQAGTRAQQPAETRVSDLPPDHPLIGLESAAEEAGRLEATSREAIAAQGDMLGLILNGASDSIPEFDGVLFADMPDAEKLGRIRAEQQDAAVESEEPEAVRLVLETEQPADQAAAEEKQPEPQQQEHQEQPAEEQPAEPQAQVEPATQEEPQAVADEDDEDEQQPAEQALEDAALQEEAQQEAAAAPVEPQPEPEPVAEAAAEPQPTAEAAGESRPEENSEGQEGAARALVAVRDLEDDLEPEPAAKAPSLAEVRAAEEQARLAAERAAQAAAWREAAAEQRRQAAAETLTALNEEFAARARELGSEQQAFLAGVEAARPRMMLEIAAAAQAMA